MSSDVRKEHERAEAYDREGAELLTPEEGERAVDEWTKEDWDTRYISLNRGHWEDIVLVVAKAQLAKSREVCSECRGEKVIHKPCPQHYNCTTDYPCPTCKGTGTN